MRKYTNVIADHNGNVIAGATVTVLDSLGASATVYSSNVVGANANPLTTGADGSFSFYAKDGTYSLTITKTGITTQTVTGVILQETTGLAVMGGYGITTSGDQAALLNAALVAINAAGAGVFKLTGNITVNSAITLQSNVGLDLNGWSITWGGSTTPMFTSATTGVLQNVRVFGGVLDCATASQMFQLLSPYHVKFESLVCASNSLVNFIFDLGVNTSGATNADGNRNAAYVDIENVLQTGNCGSLYRATGNSASQVVTLITFRNFVGVGVNIRGWEHKQWTDTIKYDGLCRAALVANNAVGMECNTGSPSSNVGVYNIIGSGLTIDTFGVLSGRVGMKLNNCKQIKFESYYNDPAAEGGQFSLSGSVGSYDIWYVDPGDLILTRLVDPATARAEAAQSKTPYILAKSSGPVTAPLDTSNNTLVTFTLPANALGLNGQLLIHAEFNGATGVTNRTCTINFGASAVVSKVFANDVDLLLEGIICNQNSASSQYCIPRFTTINGISLLAPTTAAIDTTAAVSVTLKVQKATGSDPCILKTWYAELRSDGA